MSKRTIRARCINNDPSIYRANLTLNKIYEITFYDGDLMAHVIDDSNQHVQYMQSRFEEVEDKVYSPVHGDIVG